MINLSLAVEDLRLGINLSNFQHQLRIPCCLKSISQCAIQFYIIKVFVAQQVLMSFYVYG